jgi:hypothetical protein
MKSRRVTNRVPKIQGMAVQIVYDAVRRDGDTGIDKVAVGVFLVPSALTTGTVSVSETFTVVICFATQEKTNKACMQPVV